MPLTPTAPLRPLRWPASIETLRALMTKQQEVYLVGGAVRDAYLGRPIRDIDLATPGDGRPLAQQVANKLNGAYYPLDSERGVGRALVPYGGSRLSIDIAQFRGPDLQTDLQLRDFTLNAMAVSLTGDLQAVFDPTGGLNDLQAKILRRCTPESISNDPVRTLRAVRTSIAYRLFIEPETRRDIRTNAPRLVFASAERIRDELFHILEGTRPAAALGTLQRLALLEHIIPETITMQGVQQGFPHQHNLWQHTLATVERLDTLLQVISPQRDDNITANMAYGLAAFSLDYLRPYLQAHLNTEWPNQRPHRALLMFAALLHDSGKPATKQVDNSGHIHFYEHEMIGEKLSGDRAVSLRLSNDETAHISAIVRHHMRPHWLHSSAPLTRRSIYRFWRDTGRAGVDVCLLALADYLATRETLLDHEEWGSYLETIRGLLDHYYLHFDTAVGPLALLSGQDLLSHFDLSPGPQIGVLLDQLREAQAAGEVSTREEALAWVQRFLETP